MKLKTFVFPSLMIVGLAYFQFMSQLDIVFFLKGYVALVPLQIATLIYLGYLHWNKQKKDVLTKN
ncbi:hypothetical protein NIES2119_05595 [[Phormidium ambiguum] IAM M-71]|uniref:Uncharacterized protein n=2 Tax=[Phormidium ambiguum] IAM M-71 TaxID=454136 RepID=A0A1U7IQM9_9CYAN|nr:hypothetical protein NIES2119_05595 [Phormidium ambiguum IAM M-71]